jgi:ribose 5-phosphate isomerase A
MTQDACKALAARAALDYVPGGAVIGVGTGSTVNKFIDGLALIRERVPGAVSSSEASTARLQALGIPVLDCGAAGELAVYVDGADEIDRHGCMIKGGGGALTREKIVAAQARRFVCIADASKLVAALGAFPLPVEVIPMAAGRIARQFAHIGGQAQLRLRAGQPYVTDNGQHILDVRGLRIADPLGFELEVSQWPGVVTVGVFARQKADLCLVGGEQGVRVVDYTSRPEVG